MSWLLKDLKLHIYLYEIEKTGHTESKHQQNQKPWNINDTKRSKLEKEKTAWREITKKLSFMEEKEFSQLKSRWSSHINRKSIKSIGCGISHETHSMLMELKGEYTLRETLETMIRLVHSRQTDPCPEGILKQKTTPILETFKTPDDTLKNLPFNAIDTLTSAQLNISQLQNAASTQARDIKDLLNKITNLENILNTTKN